MILDRDKILKADDIEVRELEVPEWGGSVYVRGMTGRERDQFEAGIVKQKGRNTEINMKNARAKLVVLCTVDENGKRIFGDADIALLADKSAKALDRIFSVAQELSGISKDDMEELTKNSDETDGDGSFSD
ncbi:hypothetical protein [Candidatus Darwinibacter acetoxidans]|jgi:hypothetical protein